MPARRDSIDYLRGAGLLVVAGAALGWLCVIYVVSWNVLIALHYNDFGKFYYAVLRWRGGMGLYSPNPATLIRLSPTVSRQFWDLNPPHFHLLVWPLSYLSLRQAYLAWMAINVCLAAGAVAAVRAQLTLRLSGRGWLIAAYLALAAAPTLTWFVTGQLTGILAALGTWIWIEFRRERWIRAGIATGLACGLKLFLAPLLLYFVIRRRWSAVAAGAAAIAASFAAGVALFGLAAHRDWIVALRDVQWTWAPMNASIVAPFARITVPSPRMADAPGPGFAWTAASAGVSLLVLLAGLLASLRARAADRAVCVLYLTCLLCSPLGWVYYHWILAGPGVAVFRRHDRRLVSAACAGLLPPFFLLAVPSVPFAVTLGSTYTWSTLLLWALAVAGAIRK
ncbi:MAG TPA: glycosyltransferase family 87 protein [Vicinamibacterales bacterium]|nr:glycosyltransferase family 87 protein [Vicinamibacterales bacterium]